MEEKFYIIKPAVDTEETGHVYPAVVSFDDYDFKGPNSVHKLKFGEFPDFIPDIRFKLAKGAKLCDVMGQATISAHGLLISENAKLVFDCIDIIPHKYYECSIEDHQENIHTYYWMHLVWIEMSEQISYNHSSFYKRKFNKNLGQLFIHSDDDFKQIKHKIGPRYMIGINNIKFRNEMNYHLFTYPYSSKLVVCNSAISKIENLSGLDSILDETISKDQAANH